MIAPAVRFSLLKYIARSPAHYLHALTSERPDTAAMRLGRLVHTRVLGGDAVAVYDGERRGKAWLEYATANEGREIVTIKEYDAAAPIADAVLRNADARELIIDAAHETQVSWSSAGRACTGRLDVLGDTYVADLKTTNDASPAGFARQAYRMGYHAQLAWYCDGAKRPDAYLIAVESSAPYPVTVMQITPAMLDEGRRQYRTWFELLRNCEDSNQWPEYAQTVVPLDVPGWIELEEAEAAA